MEKVQINKNNYGTRRDTIPVSSAYTDNVYLYLYVDGFYSIKPGDYIMFNRFVFSEDSKQNVPVLSKRKSVLYTYYDGEITYIVVKAEEKTLLRIKQSGITSEDDYYITEFENVTNIFAQDVVFAQNSRLTPTIQVFNPEDNTFTDIVSEIYFYETDRIEGKKNYEFIVSACCPANKFIYNTYNQTDYNDCDKDTANPTEVPMYYYLPDKSNSNVLTFKENLSGYVGQNLYYKYNALYCQSDSGTTLDNGPFSGLTVYECYLWEDVDDGGKREVLTDDGKQKYNVITIEKIIDFWGISVGLTSNIDYSHLYQEENVVEQYTDKVKNKIVEAAPVIDMEKMKFIPYCEEAMTSITYNLHFRQRDLDDNWTYVDNEEAFWNPKVLEESGETSGSTELIPDDLSESGSVFSDMLYYLGFTDSDVMNQKQKIRKSFLRLSFYDSPDPLTQKLIYYSSIFMDSGELFGKYIKAKNELLRKGKNGDNVVLNSQESEKYRLDCRFIVKNEFYTTKSSDGFNIYYFPDDVPEISGKTIYMKVEFNHAGYGRTIPMIIWPMDSGLTMDTIKEGALYIPLTLNILEEENGEKKYIYCFEENENFVKKENNTMILNLVEPKLIN